MSTKKGAYKRLCENESKTMEEIININIKQGSIEKVPLECLSLSSHTYYSLKKGGVKNLFDLISKSYEELLNIKNLGITRADEIIEKLRSLSLKLKEKQNNIEKF